jgi:hypothetical protein
MATMQGRGLHIQHPRRCQRDVSYPLRCVVERSDQPRYWQVQLGAQKGEELRFRCQMPGFWVRKTTEGSRIMHPALPVLAAWRGSWGEDSRGGDGKSISLYGAAICVVRGCEERPVNRWMCNRHAQQRAAGIIDEEGNQSPSCGSLVRRSCEVEGGL